MSDENDSAQVEVGPADGDDEDDGSLPTISSGQAPSGEPGDVVELPPPNISDSKLSIWSIWRHRKKTRKSAKKGYVQWILIDSTYPTPKMVKPEPGGGGIPEIKHDGERYLFPRDAMLPSKETGMWTVVHKKGEAEPLNLRDPSRNAIKADELQEYLDLRVSSSPPSWFDNLDLDAADVMKWMMIALVGFAVLQNFL